MCGVAIECAVLVAILLTCPISTLFLNETKSIPPVKNGSDPGFFMQSQDMMRGSLVESFQSPTFSSTWLNEKMDAAREAQELYDKSKSSEKKHE